MLKTDFISMIANESNIRHRNNKAALYSAEIKTKRRFKNNLFSIILGCILGFIVGMCHLISVSASDVKSFSNQEWIDICYTARIVEAEAGNQSELGKRLVADSVLNRLNSAQFGSDVKSIIEQENQYAEGITASDDTIRIVMEEYRKQANTEVLYFRTGHYHEFATDMFVVGDHYFSK